MIYILNRNQEVVGLLQNDTDRQNFNIYFEDLHSEDLVTGAETMRFSCIVDDNTSNVLNAGNFIAFNKNNSTRVMQIIETEEEKEEILIKHIYCETIGLELMNSVYDGSTMDNVNIKRFLDTVLQNTDWKTGYIDSNLTTNLALEIEPKEVYSLIQQYIADFGAEIQFRAEIQNNRVVGRYIDAFSKRGKNEGKRLEIHKDIKKISRKIDLSNYATKLIGVGKDNLSFKDITIADIDKPLGQNFIVNTDAFEKFNYNGKHITKKFEYDTTDPYELLRQTKKALDEMSKPQITYEIDTNIVDFDGLNIGDTCTISDMSFNPPLTINARIGVLETSKCDPSQNKAVLTNFKEIKSGISKFPIGSNDILNGAITEGKIDTQYLQTIKTDVITAAKADVEKLIANKAEIEDLNAINATIENLKVKDADIENAVIENLKVTTAEIDSLKAKDATIESLVANKADIEDLNAINASIDILQSDIADIDTLLAGNITADNIQAGSITANEIASGAITAGSGIIADGAIGNAQISSLDAAKINAGTIDTSKITVAGPNSNLKISGNRLQVFQGVGSQQIERVSLGDVNNDGSVYGFRVRGADGQTVLMDENGVKSEGITDGSITNEKISDNANIDGSKLDINSVVRNINKDGTEVIQGTKINVNGTNLETKLSTITQKQTEDSERITQAYSKITANENMINLKVDNQTYQTDKNNINTTLNKNTSEISLLKDKIALKVEQSDITNAINDIQVGGRNLIIRSTEIKNAYINTTGSITNIPNYATSDFISVSSNESLMLSKKNTIIAQDNYFRWAWYDINKNYISRMPNMSNKFQWIVPYGVSYIRISYPIDSYPKVERGNKATDWSPAPEDISEYISAVDSKVTTVNNKVGEITVDLDNISQIVASTETSTADLTTKINNLEIGGRNLLRNTNFSFANNYWGITGSALLAIVDDSIYGKVVKITGNQSSTGITQKPIITLDNRKEYTMSCYIKSNINTRIGLALNDSGLSSAQYFNIIPTWTKIYATFENNNINTVPRIYLAENKAVEIYVANIKFEKGNRPTDWSPAPEDVDSAISDVDTKVESTKTQLAEIQTNVNGITSRVGTVESKTTTLEKLVEKKLINNFSNSNTLDLWSAPGTTLKYSSIVGYYMDCLSNNQNHMIQSEYFEIDSSKSYKISLMQQFAPNSGTATFYFGIYAYDKDKNNIGVYVDKGTSLNTNPYFINKRTPTNDYGNWKTWSGYIYSHDTIIQDYTPKGNVTSCMKFSPKTKYLRTRFLHYRTGSYGDSGQGSMYFAQPAIYEIDNQIVNTEQRLKTAEQKITDEAITNTVKQNFYTKGDIDGKGYQNASQVQQKVDQLQIKFNESGGYNLLKNGNAQGGLKYWVSNGGGISVVDSSKGSAFRTTLPSGIRHGDVKLKSNTNYVYSAYMHCSTAITGHGAAPLHFWCNVTQGSGGTSACSIIDYSQKVPANTWTKVYVHIRTGNQDCWFRPFIYTGSGTGDVTVRELGLYESSLNLPYSPHPSEIYDGITTIDKDGITVTSSNVKSKTSMTASGFKITKTDTNEDVFKVNADGTLSLKGSIDITNQISGDKIRGGTISAATEINFNGGARIFGTTGAYGAGLSISAQEFRFSGGSDYYMDNNPVFTAKTANGYPGLSYNRNDSNWIRTTSSGIIPYASGGASALGTSAWPFNNIYGKNIYENGTALSSKYFPKSGGTISGSVIKITGNQTYYANYFNTLSGNVYQGNQGAMVIENNTSGRFHFLSASGLPGYLYGYSFTSKARMTMSEFSRAKRSTPKSVFDILDGITIIDVNEGKLAIPILETCSINDNEKNIDTEFIKTERTENGDIVVSTNYNSMIGLLTEAIKELKEENNKLKEENNKLQEENSKINDRLNTLENKINSIIIPVPLN